MLIVGLLTDVLLSRQLGPELKGTYYFIVTAATHISVMSGFGFEYCFPRRVAEGQMWSRIAALPVSLLLLMLGSSALLSLLVVKYYYDGFMPVTGITFWAVLFCAAVLETVFTWNMFRSLSLGDTARSLVMRYARRFLFLVALGVLLIFNVLELMPIFAAYILTLLIMTGYYFRSYWRISVEVSHFSELVEPGAFAIKLSELAILRGVMYVSALFVAPSELGALSVAWVILEALLFLPNSVAMSLFSASCKEKADYSSEKHRLVIFMLLISFLQAAVLFFSSDLIVKYIYGPAFSHAVPLVQGYALASVIIGIVPVFLTDALRNKYRSDIILSSMLSIAVGVAMSAYLFGRYHAMGAIYISVLMAFVFILFLSFMRFRNVVKSSF